MTAPAAGGDLAPAPASASSRSGPAGELPAGRVRLTGRGRRRFQSGHPWIYADDLSVEEAERGALVGIEDPAGARLGWGLYSAGSRLRVRAVSREERAPDRELWRALFARAISVRERAGLLDPRGACRLVAGDAERVPGLVVDRYKDVCVLQSGTQGADLLRDLAVELLEELLPFRCSAVVDRSDAAVRRLEGLEPRVEVVRGSLPSELLVREDELVYEVDVLGGHKTGHYLDQRENRRRAAGEARGRDVLDAFAYDGLFGIRCALAGARSVLCLEQSESALERLRRNAARNGVEDRVRAERADVMKDLRARAAAGERWGLVVLDPPAFARNRSELEGAVRGYRELNLRALRLLEPGGRLVSASCSHALREAQFVLVLAAAAHDARRDAYLEALYGAACDHPALLVLPESAYLKCAFLRVE